MRPIRTSAMLGLYLLLLLALTQLSLARAQAQPTVNLVPFHGIRASWQAGSLAIVINLVGNIIAFMPFGWLLPAVRQFRWYQTLGLGIGLSCAIELAQWCFATRASDVDDVILNSLGTWLGWLFCWLSGMESADRPIAARLRA